MSCEMRAGKYEKYRPLNEDKPFRAQSTFDRFRLRFVELVRLHALADRIVVNKGGCR